MWVSGWMNGRPINSKHMSKWVSVNRRRQIKKLRYSIKVFSITRAASKNETESEDRVKMEKRKR